jgi:hypothetical protein
VQLEQPDELEREEAEEDHEVERPRREPLAQLAEDARAPEPPHDSDGPKDPEEAEDPQAGEAAEEIEDAAAVAEVPPLGRRRQQAVGEVDDEDQRETGVHVDDQPPRLRPERRRRRQDDVDDRENRDGEDEELVGGALQVLTVGTRRGHGAGLSPRTPAILRPRAASIESP